MTLTPPRPPLPSVARGRQSRARHTPQDKGMVTAEFALAMPALAMILLLCLWAIVAGALKLRAEDAARISARTLARGDSDASARAVVRQTMKRDAAVEIIKTSTKVTVRVRSTVPTFPALRPLMPTLRVTGTATAPRER